MSTQPNPNLRRQPACALRLADALRHGGLTREQLKLRYGLQLADTLVSAARKHGYIARDAETGEWRLTEAGRAAVQRVA